MSLEIFARQSLAQFAIIYGEIFKLNEGKAINPSEIETLMWGRMCAKEANINKLGFKIPYDNIRRSKVTLPYMPDDINYTGCPVIKKNGGLYTPCCGKIAEDAYYCKTCSVDKEGNAKDLEFGTMETRDANVEDERFAPITFGEWMKAHKMTLTEVYAKLAAAGVQIEIPADQLMCRELPKRRKGRPAKSEDSVVDEDTVKPKRKAKKADSDSEEPKAKAKKASPAASESETEKPKKKAAKVPEPEPESESEEETPPKKASPKPSPKASPKASPAASESETEKPKKKAAKVPEPEPESESEEETPPKKASPKPSPKASPKASPAASESETEKPKKVSPKPKVKASKASPAASESETEKPKKKAKTPEPESVEAPAPKKVAKADKAEKPKKAEKAKDVKEPKADKAKAKAEKEPKGKPKAKVVESDSEDDEPHSKPTNAFKATVPDIDLEELAAGFEEDEENDDVEATIDDVDYIIRNGKFVCSIDSGEILGTVDGDEVVWNSDKR